MASFEILIKKTAGIVLRGKCRYKHSFIIQKFGRLDQVTKVTSDDVTVMKSWWNIYEMYRMSKMSNNTRDVTQGN